MLIAYVFFGIFAGMAAFAAAMIVGDSFWSAVLIYSLIGAAATVLTAIAHAAMNEVRARRRPILQGSGAPDSAGLESADALVSAQAVGDRGVMKILAVDDDEFILELIPKIAAKVGCPDITTASSGAQALDLIKKASTPFDCLLLDINMPGMDGIALCSAIRSMKSYRDTPIIMLTAMTDRDFLDRAFQAGASDYTIKPFDIIEFGSRLQAAQARMVAKWSGATDGMAYGAAAVDRYATQDWGQARLAPLAGVPALIEYGALENYLTRLSGSALSSAYVMAIVADQIPKAEAKAQSAAPLEILAQVALAIDEVLSPASYMMSYAGHGQFVVVGSAANLPRATVIEADIQERLNALTDNEDIGAPLSATISAGLAVRPGLIRAHRARIAFDTAINLAMDRAAGKPGALQFIPLRSSER